MKNEMVTVNGTDLQIKEWNGQRVVTFKDIDLLHGRKKGTAQWKFNYNKDRFIDGRDYYKLTNCEIHSLGIGGDYTFPRGLILITESGYYMIVKSLNDDTAWEVQRKLVDAYFKGKELAEHISSDTITEHLLSSFLDMMREDRAKYMETITHQSKDIAELQNTVIELKSLLADSLNVISADRAVFSDVMNKQHKMIVDLVEKAQSPKLSEQRETTSDRTCDVAAWKQNINDLVKVVADETKREKNMVLSDAYKMMKSLYGIQVDVYQREYHAVTKTPRCPSMFETICWMETKRETSLNGTMERILWSMLDDQQVAA